MVKKFDNLYVREEESGLEEIEDFQIEQAQKPTNDCTIRDWMYPTTPVYLPVDKQEEMDNLWEAHGNGYFPMIEQLRKIRRMDEMWGIYEKGNGFPPVGKQLSIDAIWEAKSYFNILMQEISHDLTQYEIAEYEQSLEEEEACTYSDFTEFVVSSGLFEPNILPHAIQIGTPRFTDIYFKTDKNPQSRSRNLSYIRTLGQLKEALQEIRESHGSRTDEYVVVGKLAEQLKLPTRNLRKVRLLEQHLLSIQDNGSNGSSRNNGNGQRSSLHKKPQNKKTLTDLTSTPMVKPVLPGHSSSSYISPAVTYDIVRGYGR